jgi:capsid protein
VNFPEVVYKLVTGQWKVDRHFAQQAMQAEGERMKLYAGAQPTTNRPYPAVLSTPEDFRQAFERIVLIRAARQMEEDFQFFDGILNDFETYVVGDLTYRAATGNPDADRAINDYLQAQFETVDFSNRLDLNYIARLALRSMKRDGECGFKIIDTGDTLKLVCLSGDRIGNPLIGANIGPNNYNGIIVDEATSAPLFYDLYYRIPKLNSYEFQERIEANYFIHYYQPFRFEQYHGVTVFKNSIEHAFDIKQILDFSKMNIKWRSAQLPYVTNEQGRPRGNGYAAQPVSSTGEPQPFSVVVDGVTQSFFKLGEGVMNYPNDFPNTQFTAILEELKRDIAIGCKLPLEFCYRSQTGGVVQRFYANKAERTFDHDKKWLKLKLLTPLKNRLIQKGIYTGFLNLDQFGPLVSSPARFQGSWQMGRSVTVDYKNENETDIKIIEAGLGSAHDYAAEHGEDLERIRQQNKEYALAVFQDADEISKKTGVDKALIIPFLRKIFPNPGAGLKAADSSTTQAGDEAGEQQQASAEKDLDPFAIRQKPS